MERETRNVLAGVMTALANQTLADAAVAPLPAPAKKAQMRFEGCASTSDSSSYSLGAKGPCTSFAFSSSTTYALDTGHWTWTY